MSVGESPAAIAESGVSFELTTEAISNLEETYGALSVQGPEDKEGIAECRKARLHVKELRVAVEKRRKDLKADALEFGRKVDSAAKDLTSRLTPIEQRLQFQEDTAKRERERLAEEARQERQRQLAERMQKLLDVGSPCPEFEIADMDEIEFAAKLQGATEEKERREAEEARRAGEAKAEKERQARIAREQAEKQAELDRKEAEMKAAQERQQKELADKQRQLEEAERKQREALQARQREIDAEAKRLADEKAAEEKRIADELAEKERQARIEQERAERVEREKKEEAKRLAAAKAAAPDVEKIDAFIISLRELSQPTLRKSKASQRASKQIAAAVARACDDVERVKSELESGVVS